MNQGTEECTYYSHTQSEERWWGKRRSKTIRAVQRISLFSSHRLIVVWNGVWERLSLSMFLLSPSRQKRTPRKYFLANHHAKHPPGLTKWLIKGKHVHDVSSQEWKAQKHAGEKEIDFLLILHQQFDPVLSLSCFSSSSFQSFVSIHLRSTHAKANRDAHRIRYIKWINLSASREGKRWKWEEECDSCEPDFRSATSGFVIITSCPDCKLLEPRVTGSFAEHASSVQCWKAVFQDLLNASYPFDL